MLKPGDVVRYAKPDRHEEELRVVVLEAHYDVPVPRARIRLLDSGMQFPPEETVAIDELQKVMDRSAVQLLANLLSRQQTG